MNLFKALALVVAAQAGLWALHHFGQIGTFWLVMLEIVAIPGALAILVVGWAASIDWSK